MSFFTALSFLTVIPSPPAKKESLEKPGRSLAFFPVIGLLIGVILYGLYTVLRLVFPLPLTAALLAAFLAVITGAHHLDGLMDTCDAMVAGRTRQQRLQIMSDTKTGTFGITGVCILLLVKYAAVSVIIDPASLILFPMASRWAIGYCILIFPAAKSAGMGYAFKTSTTWLGIMVSTILALLISTALSGLLESLLLLGVLLILILCLALFLSRLFGGLTGDCYGALVEAGEVLALLLLILLGQLSQMVPTPGIFKVALPW